MTLYVRDDGTIDEQLEKLGLKRTHQKGYPLNGQLYLGRGVHGTIHRGIYRSMRKALPAEGFSGADLFEFLDVLDPKGTGVENAEEMRD